MQTFILTWLSVLTIGMWLQYVAVYGIQKKLITLPSIVRQIIRKLSKMKEKL